METLMNHIGCIALFTAGYLYFQHRYETKEIRKKMREKKLIEKSLPRAKVLKLLIPAIIITSTANAQLLLGMGVGYSNSVYGELVVGGKVNKTAVYYNQIALLSADKPAYFGLATSYDVVSNDDFKITASAGYYFRKMSSDVKGKVGGNYYVPGGSISYNKSFFSVTVRYLEGVQVGILFSGLLHK